MKDIKQKLLLILDQIQSLGGEVRDLVFEPAAKEEEIVKVEQDMGIKIPHQLRDCIKNISAHCEASWQFDKNIYEDFPEGVKGIFAGDIHWGLHLLKSFNDKKKSWIENVFSNPDDSYDKVWYDKFAFLDVENGDLIAIDVAPNSEGKVVYLSHADSQGHGVVLANSFYEFIEKWVDLGCVGAEDWQWMKFVEDKTNGLDTNCENAIAWKKIIGLENK